MKKELNSKKKRINYNLDTLLDIPEMEFEKFHIYTKMENFPEDISIDQFPKEWTAIDYKRYRRLNKVVLPQPNALFPKGTSLHKALVERQSRRAFGVGTVPLDIISPLLHFSAGLKNRRNVQSPQRFYPSGGGRYPLELYLISINTELSKGVYHYNVKNHILEELLLLEKFNYHKYFHQKWGKKASFILIITAIFNRNVIKYSDRGYRHVLSETGHIAQNFYLNSVALNLNCSSIGGYKDDEVNKLLDIDGKSESVVYAMAFGQP